MPVRKRPSGRFEATLKDGRTFIASRRFDRRRDAEAWLDREEAALAGGLDVRAGQTRVRTLVPEWVKGRKTRVSAGTAHADAEMAKRLSPALGAMAVAAVDERHLDAWYQWLAAKGLAQGSVVRFRSSLSSFFTWAVSHKYVAVNPVASAPAPKPKEEPVEMKPFSEEELAEVVAACTEQHEHYGPIIELLAYTGLRWGELKALRVGDINTVPFKGLHVTRSQSEGQKVKATKSNRGRLVPIPNAVWPTVEKLAEGKSFDELLVTGPNGGQLWAAAFKRGVKWDEHGRGRRLHDLRHTAACLWLARGVNSGSVKQWLGHASIATTNRYLHWMGTMSDAAGLALLNAPRQGVTPSEVTALPSREADPT